MRPLNDPLSLSISLSLRARVRVCVSILACTAFSNVSFLELFCRCGGGGGVAGAGAVVGLACANVGILVFGAFSLATSRGVHVNSKDVVKHLQRNPLYNQSGLPLYIDKPCR